MSKDVKEVLSSIAEWSDRDNKPRGIVQRFWQHFYLRVIVGLLVVVVIVGAGIWFGYTLIYTERIPLVSYVPSNAWLYAEFDLQIEEWNKLAEMDESLVADINVFLTDNGLDQRLLDIVDRLGLVGVYNKKEDVYEWVWIARTEKVNNLELFVQKDTFVRRLSDNVVIFSQSEVVRDFSRRPQPISTAVDAGDNILWSGFIRPRMLSTPLEKTSERRIDLRALSQLIKSNAPKQVQFTVNLVESGLIVVSDTDISNMEIDVPSTPLADIIVFDAVVTETLKQINILFEDLPLPEYYWRQRQNSLDQKYQFDSKGLFELFDVPMTVIARVGTLEDDESVSENIIANGLFGTEWVFIFTAPVSAEKESLLKEVAKRILAQEDPDEIVRTLPDDTFSRELVVTPESYVFKDHENLKDTVFISTRDGSKQFFFKRTDSGLRLSNSFKLLEESLVYSNDPITCVYDRTATGVFSSNALKNIPFLKYAQSFTVSLEGGSFAGCIRLK